MDDQDTLNGKTALVCQAGSGIGRAIAAHLAECGVTVAAHDFSPIHLDLTVQLILGKGGKVKDYVADISKKIPAQLMLHRIQNEIGPINILINNPSIHPRKLVLEMDDWDWLRTLEMNLSASFLMTQLVGREMLAQGSGLMINLVRRGDDQGISGSSAFMASMAGLAGFQHAAALELMEHRIRVHTIYLTGQHDCDNRNNETIESSTPFGGWQTLSEADRVISWINWLCSQEAEALGGQEIDPCWGLSGL